MPIYVSWYDEREHIVYERVVGAFTLDEYIKMIDECNMLINSKDHPVHVIFDMTEGQGAPRNAMAGARYAQKKVPPNQSSSVFVNPDVFTKTLLQLASKVGLTIASKVTITDTIEEAIALIDAEYIYDAK